MMLMLCITCSAIKAQTFNIKDYGANGNGLVLNTPSIQKTIDDANAKGGGTVIIPEGVFLTGTIRLKSNVQLYLAKGAVLLGSTNLSDYEKNERWYALILAHDQQHIAITGEGTINGQGKDLAKNVLRLVKNDAIKDSLKLNRPNESLRPQLIEFIGCTGVKIQGVNLINSSCWVETYDHCNDMVIDSIHVESTAYWNNDGMDIVDCKNVKVINCDINAADDGICLKSSDPKSACENIDISNCRVRSSASGVKFGTASVGGFKNIRIHHIYVYNTYRTAISLEIVDGGIMENVDINDVTAKNTGGAIFIRLGHRKKDVPPGIIRHIHIKDVTVEVPKGKPDTGYDIAGPPEEDIYPHNLLPTEIVGLPGYPVQDVTLENITVTYAGGADKKHAYVSIDSLATIPEREGEYPEYSMFGELPSWGIYARHAEELHFKNITLKYIEMDFRPAVVINDVSGLNMYGLNIPTANGSPVIVLKDVNKQIIKNVSTPFGNKQAILNYTNYASSLK